MGERRFYSAAEEVDGRLSIDGEEYIRIVAILKND